MTLEPITNILAVLSSLDSSFPSGGINALKGSARPACNALQCVLHVQIGLDISQKVWQVSPVRPQWCRMGQ